MRRPSRFGGADAALKTRRSLLLESIGPTLGISLVVRRLTLDQVSQVRILYPQPFLLLVWHSFHGPWVNLIRPAFA